MGIIEDYVPTVPPLQLSAEARNFLDVELRRIADFINTREVFIVPKTTEPSQPVNGLIEYADGVGWNPGSGAGFYGYENGAWTKL